MTRKGSLEGISGIDMLLIWTKVHRQIHLSKNVAVNKAVTKRRG